MCNNPGAEEEYPIRPPANRSTDLDVSRPSKENSRLVTIMSCGAMVVGAAACLASVGVGLSLFLVGSMLLAET